MEEIVVYIDGASFRNPGPAGAGIYFKKGPKEISKKFFSKSIGEKTNNQAEYSAAIFALEKIKQIFGKKISKNLIIRIFSDSELLVKQMSGLYKVQDPKIQKLFLSLWNLSLDFKKVRFQAIPREKNKQADSLVNQALDQEARSRKLI